MLSAVIITLNEAQNIARCLQSLAGVADEIIVLDSYSTDDTLPICAAFANARLVQAEWQGYSTSKNYANGLATYDMILSLDADEELSPELKKSILEYKKSYLNNKNSTAKTAECSRLTSYCGAWVRHGGWYPDRKIRIFNRTQLEWRGAVHETLEPIGAARPTTVRLQGDLLHHSFHTHEALVKQLDKYASIAAQTRYDKGERGSYLKIIYKTVFKFFRNYILKLGFLDGKLGVIIAFWTAKETYWRYYRLLLLQKNGN